jgi:hypothetical protein
MANGTKTAVSRAHIAQNQDSRRPSRPTITPVRAIGIGTDRFQPQTLERGDGMLKGFSSAKPPLEPRGQSFVIDHNVFLNDSRQI